MGRFHWRVLAGLAGLGVIGLLLRSMGLQAVTQVVFRAASIFPVLLLLEAGVILCTVFALRLLYREGGQQPSFRTFLRAGLVGYTMMGILPAGRTAAEATRAALLARHTSQARAWAAALQLQGLSLLANAVISVPAAIALWQVMGLRLPTALILGNLLITGILGSAILFASRRSRVGRWLSHWIRPAERFGEELDRHLGLGEVLPPGPLGWEILGRIIQVVQNGVLVAAVGGRPGVGSAFCSEGLHLVGAALGDLIPAQLGATEVSYRFSASALALKPEEAMSVALLAHATQAVWIAVGLLVLVLWPSRRPQL